MYLQVIPTNDSQIDVKIDIDDEIIRTEHCYIW